ncbi:hypothetical protein RvY_15230 [Ramazzottius varieornatus]|uniref:Uncharacterized protein n=1 Tax=Ramazzottius varieornatus TaxID=947166 RepID=A0A1D1VU46_RAMVA|nr:hypothetical protein RvY_15230 [Ramazzottius varieornatus]
MGGAKVLRYSDFLRCSSSVSTCLVSAALTDVAVIVGAAMALDGAVDVAVDVDMIVTDNGDTAPGTAEEGGPRKATRTWTRLARRINLSSVLMEMVE